MAASIIPSEQETLINPYSNKLFDFDTHSSKVYVSRSVNNLLKSIGDDCILDGLISNATYNSSTDEITIHITPGKAIVDSTLVEISSSTQDNQLSIDVTSLDQTGCLIVALSYKFLNTIYANNSKFKLFYLASNSIDTVPVDFQTDYDRLVLAKFIFDKTSKTVTKIASELNTPATQVIRGKSYQVYPRSKLLLNSFDEIKNLFTVLNYD